MVEVPDTNLWLGNAADLRDIPRMLQHGVTAIVDLAIEEQVPTIPRATNYCRFVLTDDGENDAATILAAIKAAAAFLAGGHPTAICCSAGLNRSVCIGAAALAYNIHSNPARLLEMLAEIKHIDVNPALWNQVVGILSRVSMRSR